MMRCSSLAKAARPADTVAALPLEGQERDVRDS